MPTMLVKEPVVDSYRMTPLASVKRKSLRQFRRVTVCVYSLVVPSAPSHRPFLSKYADGAPDC